jgi:SAM-dependent methyltransferase
MILAREGVMALYDTIGGGYAAYRRAEPRIAAVIEAALGDAGSVVNVGAGAGSYEPVGRDVVAVEPSGVMIAQRPVGAARCVRGVAEALPLEDGSVDAAMTVLSAHHWTDLERGLREMARVARERVVVVTWVPEGEPFWLTEEYFPEIAAYDRSIFPGSEVLRGILERVAGPVREAVVPIPHDCVDGMLCAYWRRPEMYLDGARRAAISSFARFDAGAGVERLRGDLERGEWRERYGAVLGRTEMDLGYRVVSCEVRR